ncbi:Golgi apparatus membrane protein tvp18 [Exophiala xenobiotica]|nr:Golgi apparatus membrane protein tvp18 [Exophiala xenobiotica]
MTLAEEFKSRNFSIYGQWLGVLCIILGFALGIANIFHFNLLIIFSIILLYVSRNAHFLEFPAHVGRRCSALILIFIEIPLLLRICPTSSKFDAFIRRFTTNYMRAAIYGVMSLVQWLSLIVGASSLVAAAVVLALAGACYALAGLKQQDFVGSKTLGGQGVAQMIV